MKKIQRAILFILFTSVTLIQSPVLLAQQAVITPANPQQKFLFKLTHFVDNLHAAMMAFGMANGVLKQGASG